MVFADDTEAALLAAVELANSELEPDTLTTTDQLAAFFDRHGYTGSRTGQRAELEQVRGVRRTVRDLLSSDRDEAVEQVNTMLASARAVPRLVRHGDLDWHIHAIDDDAALSTRIIVETAMAMVDVIRADEMSRLALCADEDCTGVVLDLSRNRSRKYCSATCSNRNAVAAYRARKSQD